MDMNLLFRACVVFLEEASKALGITYVEINIWLFVIIMPGFIILQGLTNLILVRTVFNLLKKSKK